MDFFDRQDQARGNTRLLIIYFVIAVIGIVASVYVASLLIFYGAQSQQSAGGGALPVFTLWQPELFLFVTLGTLSVIAISSLYKTATLAKGGSVVAETLGGRLVSPNTNHPDERKLMNVVEEMAIASGVPVPKVYVLDNEKSINAFAAGHTADDAAIGVTRGGMTLLDRDELQGVIGHEFSHILNGDMRLNLRLMGVLFGILFLAVIGRVLIYARGGRDRNLLPLMGFALIIIGSIGVFFGRLIQAALSRQREFLSDASAVQFTRNPAGLSRALQKIGGAGSKIESAHAEEASHMFFENGMGKSFHGLFATHPPLDKRIRAIDPGWDGRFSVSNAPPAAPSQARSTVTSPPSGFSVSPVSALAEGPGSNVGMGFDVIQAEAVLSSLGNPTLQHMHYAEKLQNSIPERLRFAAHESHDATALIYALLLSFNEDLRTHQLKELSRRIPLGISETTAKLWPDVASIAGRMRLPLVNLSLPALRQLRLDEIQQFQTTLQWLIESDGHLGVFEFALQKIVRRHLAFQLGDARSTTSQYRTIDRLMPDCSVVLSALARVSSNNTADIEKAFSAGEHRLRTKTAEPQLLSSAACKLEHLDSALDHLALAAPQVKKALLTACVEVVCADQVIREREAELLRAVAETLGCPIPPFVDKLSS
ncbi:M48 family metallopeptidase [Pelovirga terrestris]|uniref:M48 family metallopeptidase n=1 Tax=Pelovirga terrestris TaxID=2771352 RepID=A0A8J6QWK9_9BACT|nr:M48 family metallopeptidase [Pelovirga terrestris]MBD1399981.1 M48 family metallopeptidase [Pelovirga terrestris]